MEELHITSFYKFVRLSPDELLLTKARLERAAGELSLRGLVVLAAEGINGTVSGLTDSIVLFQNDLGKLFGLSEGEFKNTRSIGHPFSKFSVKLRNEIVTSGGIPIPDECSEETYLSPREWQQLLESGAPLTLLDVRNDYEVSIGRFQGAVTLGLENFSEFPRLLEKHELPKNQTVLIYCTGGVRCEKALIEMKARGYDDVRQLAGGILKYLEEFPGSRFEGECFVFDDRVALDQGLRPSNVYVFCPHCGNPGEIQMTCCVCARQGKICNSCFRTLDVLTCSKNCAYQYRQPVIENEAL